MNKWHRLCRPLSESTTTTSSSHGEMSSSASTSGREISVGELLTQRWVVYEVN